MAFHGAPRFTGDLDILVPPAAVAEFGFPTGKASPEYLIQQRKILQLGRIPVQLHVMTNISGISWDAAWASRERGAYANVQVYYLGRDALLANKRASGRPKDLADIAALEKP